MHVVIFEGSHWSSFAPLSLGRPVFGLTSGGSTLLEKQIRHLKPSRLTLWVRPEMEAYCRQRLLPRLKLPTQINVPLDDEQALLCSGRTVHLAPFNAPEKDEVVVLDEGNTLVRMACVRRPGLAPEDVFQRSNKWLDLLKLPTTTAQARMVETLWDLIHWNSESLVEDYAALQDASASHPAGPYHMINPDHIWLGSDVNLMPGCVLDASKGAIAIGTMATIGANSVITGPCFIGPTARIRPLTQVREGTTIGVGCTIGGEVSLSIFLDYSNKGHEGFVGHSYIGKWANLGSGTTTSNLKNTYGPITAQVAGKQVATGKQFLGALIGDHSKTAILSRLMAGTYIGFGSMLATSGPAPKMIPSFTFLTDTGPEPYAMDKAIEVTKRVFARRDREFNSTDEQLMKYVANAAPQVEG